LKLPPDGWGVNHCGRQKWWRWEYSKVDQSYCWEADRETSYEEPSVKPPITTKTSETTWGKKKPG